MLFANWTVLHVLNEVLALEFSYCEWECERILGLSNAFGANVYSLSFAFKSKKRNSERV